MLAAAKVLKSYGIDGGVLLGLKNSIEEINLKEPVYIYFDGLPVPFFFESLSPKGAGKALAHLSGVDSLEDAEEIVGQTLWLEGADDSEEGDDFTGWEVFDGSRSIGVVDGIEPIPGNLCLLVEGRLIPLHEDFIVEADPEGRKLYLNLPEGLLDL